MERSFVETNGSLLVDCTSTIKLIKGLLKTKKYLVSVLETVRMDGFKLEGGELFKEGFLKLLKRE